MKLVWADEARRDRLELIGFVETQSLINAIELDDRLYEAAEQLIPSPAKVARVAFEERGSWWSPMFPTS